MRVKEELGQLLVLKYGKLFGSVFYGVHTKSSDIDFLVKVSDIPRIKTQLKKHKINVLDLQYGDVDYDCIEFVVNGTTIHLVLVPDIDFEACIMARDMLLQLPKKALREESFRKQGWGEIKKVMLFYFS